MDYDAVFWDFDGVILDSVDVKTKAFAEMFKRYGPNVQKKVIQYHLEHGGVSRYDKFRYYFESILNKPINSEQIENLSAEFSNHVLNKVIESKFCNGALETLKMLKRNMIPAYVVSGTPDDEIKLIVKRKNISHYFFEVHGSPSKKWEITQEILDRKGYNPRSCIFIGDSPSDYHAAQKTGMQFIGIVPIGSYSPFPTGTKISSVVSIKV